MHWIAPSEKDAANDALEKRLWSTANQFWVGAGTDEAGRLRRMKRAEGKDDRN